MKNKKSFELSFGVIFSIIAGIVILLIAIYATTRIIGTGTSIKYSEAATEISSLLNPIVNGITSAYATRVELKKESRIYLKCFYPDYRNYFGKQTVSFSEKSGLIKKWPAPGLNISFYNKYVFSENIEQGKTIYIFSKPFYSGFRVDDLVFMNMDKYCFVSPPSFIQEEISDLEIKNINISSDINSCKKEELKVCFGFSNDECNVSVYGTCDSFECENEYETGYVEKKGKQVNYYSSLIYAAIFSSPENYECNIARLGNKISELAQIYKDKIGIVKLKECNSVIEPHLNELIELSTNLSSRKLEYVYEKSKIMDKENCEANCKIYSSGSC
jgi:hypothetical protein